MYLDEPKIALRSIFRPHLPSLSVYRTLSFNNRSRHSFSTSTPRNYTLIRENIGFDLSPLLDNIETRRRRKKSWNSSRRALILWIC